jgi:hypothetical protein
VGEVGTGRIHHRDAAGTAELLQYGVLVVILFDQRRQVLVLIARQNDRAQALEFAHDGRFGGRLGQRELVQQGRHPSQEFELFGDHGVGQDASPQFSGARVS